MNKEDKAVMGFFVILLTLLIIQGFFFSITDYETLRTTAFKTKMFLFLQLPLYASMIGLIAYLFTGKKEETKQ